MTISEHQGVANNNGNINYIVKRAVFYLIVFSLFNLVNFTILNKPDGLTGEGIIWYLPAGLNFGMMVVYGSRFLLPVVIAQYILMIVADQPFSLFWKTPIIIAFGNYIGSLFYKKLKSRKFPNHLQGFEKKSRKQWNCLRNFSSTRKKS